MSPEENKAIVSHWNEELWKGNQAMYDKCVDPNCLFHGIGGQEEHKNFTGITIQRLAEGKIVEEWTEADLLGQQQIGAIRAPFPTS